MKPHGERQTSARTVCSGTPHRNGVTIYKSLSPLQLWGHPFSWHPRRRSPCPAPSREHLAKAGPAAKAPRPPPMLRNARAKYPHASAAARRAPKSSSEFTAVQAADSSIRSTSASNARMRSIAHYLRDDRETPCVGRNGAQGRDRTTDTAIFSRMLYQLSYLGAASNAAKTAWRESAGL